MSHWKRKRSELPAYILQHFNFHQYIIIFALGYIFIGLNKQKKCFDYFYLGHTTLIRNNINPEHLYML